MDDQIISQEGYNKLKEELERRINIKRPEIAAQIEASKELGDLSENAEYHQIKDEQAFNEGRIAELSSLLKNLTVVTNRDSKEKVGMGSIVTIKVNGEERKYTIVSFNEADPGENKISNESPLGKAFLNKRVGDKVNVATPRGEMEYEILEIE